MPAGDATLPKAQRLSSKTAIEALFNEGKSGFLFPFKYFVRLDDEQPLPRLLISVGKRNHKRANKRNTIKRRVREAFRLNKTPLMELGKGIDIAFVYVSKEVENYKTIENAVRKIISASARRD